MARVSAGSIGNITVSAAGDGAIQDGADSSIEATVRDYTNSNPLAVVLTDTTGDSISTLAVSNAGLTELADAITGNQVDVDIKATDLDLVLGTDISNVFGVASVVGAGTEAGAIRVTIATDSTGLLSVDDNASSLTVDNAGLTELAAAINASSQMDVNIAASNATVTVSATNLDIRDLAQATDSVSIGDGTDTIDVLADGADNIANTVNQLVTAAILYGFDGTAFDRITIGGGTEATALRVTVASDSTGVLSVDDNGGAITVDNGGTFAVQDSAAEASLSVLDDWDNAASDGASVSGDVAHDGVDAGEPVKIGHKAIAHGTNPTAVAANDRTDSYANRAGIPFVIGGHPNPVNIHINVTDADGTQTDTALVTVSAGTKIVVTYIAVACDNANTGDVAFRIGFGTANTPANDAASGMLLTHPGLDGGAGMILGNGGGILGVGADGSDLRLTCEDPVAGSFDVTVGYYTIES